VNIHPSEFVALAEGHPALSFSAYPLHFLGEYCGTKESRPLRIKSRANPLLLEEVCKDILGSVLYVVTYERLYNEIDMHSFAGAVKHLKPLGRQSRISDTVTTEPEYKDS
jgi:hypothetical protein